MYPEPRDPPHPDLSAAAPSPDLRERVLGRCRTALDARHAARRRQQQWQWRLAAGAALLLLFNAVQEQQCRARIAALEGGGPRIARTTPAPAAIGSLRARALLLAALLRGPDAL